MHHVADRETQLRIVARLCAVGGWALSFEPLTFHPSPEWLRLHDYPPGEQPTARDVLQLIDRDDRPEIERRLRRCAREGLAFEMVIGTTTRSGRHAHLRLIVEPEHDRAGRIVRIHGACQDVTSQVERERELAEHRSRLEELVEQRTRDLRTFSYALAHDMRAPLSAMAGFAQAAQERLRAQDAAALPHYLERIVTNARRAESLIEGILTLIGAVQAPLHKREVDLTAIAWQAIEHLKAGQPHRVADVQIESGLRAHADPRLVLSVIDNLVSNAWKFTAPRAVALIAVGQREDGAFFVRDNGVGFTMDEARQLFEPLRRLANARDFRGSGVGLATASRIVHRHGGRIWADAAPDKGATFWFTLPS